MAQAKWMMDPAISDIPSEKLLFLEQLVFESQKLTQKEMLSFALSLAKRKKENSITFSKEEMELIITTIKKYCTQDEISRIDKAMKLREQAATE